MLLNICSPHASVGYIFPLGQEILPSLTVTKEAAMNLLHHLCACLKEFKGPVAKLSVIGILHQEFMSSRCYTCEYYRYSSELVYAPSKFNPSNINVLLQLKSSSFQKSKPATLKVSDWFLSLLPSSGHHCWSTAIGHVHRTIHVRNRLHEGVVRCWGRTVSTSFTSHTTSNKGVAKKKKKRKKKATCVTWTQAALKLIRA